MKDAGAISRDSICLTRLRISSIETSCSGSLFRGSALPGVVRG